MGPLTGALLLAGGLLVVGWAAERFTDGALGAARRWGLSPFALGVLVSGLEPENLATGLAAALGDRPGIALGSVVGAAAFLLSGALGLTLLLAPMAVAVPPAAVLALLAAVAGFAAAVATGGVVDRREGVGLVLLALLLLGWLARAARSPGSGPAPPGGRAVGPLLLGTAGLVLGAELVVAGAGALVDGAGLSETVLGMLVVGMGESTEEVARMVAPARRGHPELAWGNVVGTTVVLLGLNAGLIALPAGLRPAPLARGFHLPFLAGCALLAAGLLLRGRRVGRGTGAILLGLFALYAAANLAWLRP